MLRQGDHFSFLCTCGAKLRAMVSQVGHKAKCSKCGRRLIVPKPKDRQFTKPQTPEAPPWQGTFPFRTPLSSSSRRTPARRSLVGLIVPVLVLIVSTVVVIAALSWPNEETPDDTADLADYDPQGQVNTRRRKGPTRSTASSALKREPHPEPKPQPKPQVQPEPQPEAEPELVFADIVARVKSSVVTVYTESASGSGFVVNSNQGLIVTNKHVVAGGGNITVRFHDHRFDRETYPAVVKLIHANADIAVLEVKRPKQFPPALAFGKTADMREGEDIFTIGSPGGIGNVLEQTITKGIISSARRKLYRTKCFQIDAPINPGNSGGPLFNLHGEVIGVNTYGLVRFGRENLNFAIYADYVVELLLDNSKSLEREKIKYIVADESEKFFTRGVTEMLRGKWSRAVTALTEAINRRQDFAKAFWYRGWCYFAWGKGKEALEDIQEAIRLCPEYGEEISEEDLADLYCASGDSCMKRKLYSTATEYYTHALELSPEKARAYYQRGCACFSSGKFEQAFRDYRKALELEPGEVVRKAVAIAYHNRGVSYARLKQHNNAIRHYTKAIKLDPNVGLYYLNRGLSYEMKREKEMLKAQRDYAAALALGTPKPPEWKDPHRRIPQLVKQKAEESRE